MAAVLGWVAGLFGTGGAAAGAGAATTAAASTAVGAASSGISLASILQGTATVLGVLTSIGAGNAEADRLEAAAVDAKTEQSLETLQGISRRTSIRRQMAEAIGAQNVAYAASGVDLSFGTARAARTDAFREADLALATDTGTEQTRVARLAERAKNYRRSAKMARRMGVLNAVSGAASTAVDFFERG